MSRRFFQCRQKGRAGGAGLRIWVAGGVGLGLVAALLVVGLSTREKNAGVDKENKEVGSATVEERDWIVLGDVANETGRAGVRHDLARGDGD